MTDLSADDKQFKRYFMMNKRQFEEIIQVIGPSLRVRMYRLIVPEWATKLT